ncbi:MAG: hypothetical protein KJ726_04425 [Verrucomicrobia bacterium]|nr:hypothetical protein [Verrucomicrobiota bacterium]
MTEPATPMMSQYRRIKRDLPPDAILFFRLGDFYEMFFEDAKAAAAILDIALTKRQGVPMCGVPYHAAEMYLGKLIRAGRKVAICDQVEDPAAARGIVQREVTRVVTPGTILEENVLESARHNYLAGVSLADDRIGVALLDLSTGSFTIEEHRDPAALRDPLAQAAPSECIVPEAAKDDPRVRSALEGCGQTLVTAYEDWTFEPGAAAELLTRHFQVHSLAGFGCEDQSAAVGAAGAVLHYVVHELHRQVGHVRQIRLRNPADYMVLDESTVANLDLVATRAPVRAGVAPNLLHVLDSTRTPMGARLLREWVLRPLTSLEGIRRRHDAVEAFFRDRPRLADLRERIGRVRDLERLIARLGAGAGFLCLPLALCLGTGAGLFLLPPPLGLRRSTGFLLPLPLGGELGVAAVLLGIQ